MMKTRAVRFGALVALLPVALVAQERSEQVMYEGEFDVRSGGSLTVDLADMDVTVQEGSGSVATVRVFASARDMAWGREIYDRSQFEAGASGGNLTLTAVNPRIQREEWERGNWVSLRAEVTVPGRYDLDLHTGDGDIRVGSFEGEFRARSGDGDVRVDALVGSRIEIRTADGDVSAESLDASEIVLHTSDGDLRSDRVNGALTAESSDGDIRFGIQGFEGLSVRTGDGDVMLSVDPSIAADVFIEAEDVDMSRDFSVSGRLRDRNVEGSINGGGPDLRVRTGDGSVTIRSR